MTREARRYQEAPLDLTFSFADDLVTWAAKWGTRGRRVHRVEDIVRHAARAIEHVERHNASRAARGQLELKATIRSITITGHGSSGAWLGPSGGPDRLNLEALKEDASTGKLSEDAQLLKKLRPLWSANNNGLTLNMCRTAAGQRGQDFLAELSSLIGARVKGWDDNFEIRPCGKEFTATPDKQVAQTGDTGRTAYLECAYYDNLAATIRNPLTAARALWNVGARVLGVK